MMQPQGWREAGTPAGLLRRGRGVARRHYRQRACGFQADADFASNFASEFVRLPAVFKMDSILEAREVQIERKRFHFEFRENERGRFLRITEEAHGRRNTIIIPSTGVNDFTAAIDDVLGAGGQAST